MFAVTVGALKVGLATDADGDSTMPCGATHSYVRSPEPLALPASGTFFAPEATEKLAPALATGGVHDAGSFDAGQGLSCPATTPVDER